MTQDVTLDSAQGSGDASAAKEHAEDHHARLRDKISPKISSKISPKAKKIGKGLGKGLAATFAAVAGYKLLLLIPGAVALATGYSFHQAMMIGLGTYATGALGAAGGAFVGALALGFVVPSLLYPVLAYKNRDELAGPIAFTGGVFGAATGFVAGGLTGLFIGYASTCAVYDAGKDPFPVFQHHHAVAQQHEITSQTPIHVQPKRSTLR